MQRSWETTSFLSFPKPVQMSGILRNLKLTNLVKLKFLNLILIEFVVEIECCHKKGFSKWSAHSVRSPHILRGPVHFGP